MSIRQRRYPKGEIAQRGNAIYEFDIRPHSEADNYGNYVAIDVETAAWAMDARAREAGDRLRRRVPDAQTWLMRIGHSLTRRFGAGHMRSPAR